MAQCPPPRNTLLPNPDPLVRDPFVLMPICRGPNGLKTVDFSVQLCSSQLPSFALPVGLYIYADGDFNYALSEDETALLRELRDDLIERID